ncbi:NUDIX hydrolase [Patescibacteria group bacterium]|nr:NUDIX hydrolase [Patescibacteria group bacterium]
MHRSVAAVIRNKDGEILMLDRVNPPFGWACPAGHANEEENPEQAMIREVKEEVNVDVKKYKLLHHEFIEWNECKKGVKGHDFFVYEITEWKGDVKSNYEAKNIKWISEEEIQGMAFEPVWEYFIKKLNLFQ